MQKIVVGDCVVMYEQQFLIRQFVEEIGVLICDGMKLKKDVVINISTNQMVGLTKDFVVLSKWSVMNVSLAKKVTLHKTLAEMAPNLYTELGCDRKNILPKKGPGTTHIGYWPSVAKHLQSICYFIQAKLISSVRMLVHFNGLRMFMKFSMQR